MRSRTIQSRTICPKPCSVGSRPIAERSCHNLAILKDSVALRGWENGTRIYVLVVKMTCGEPFVLKTSLSKTDLAMIRGKVRI